jgi:PAS domain S-box-containing protein
MNSSPKVLIVEDDNQQARFMQLILTRHHPPFDVHVANDGPLAVEMASKQEFDIITLDYNLPSMTGLEILEQLKKLGVSTPIIMVTGQGDEKIAVKAMRNGALDYITKSKEQINLLPRVILRTIREHSLAQQLEQSRKRYFDLFRNAVIAIIVIDANTFEIQQINESAESLLGISAEEGRKKAFYNLVAPEQQPIIESFFNNIKNTNRATIDTLYLLHRDKKMVATDVSGNLINSGKQALIELFITDIRDKLKMHRQLQLSQQRLLSLFNGITDMICVIDSSYKLLMGNKRYLEFTSNTGKSIMRKQCYETLFGRDTPCEKCPALETYETGESHFIEVYHGSRIYQISTFPMRDLEGRPDFIVEYTKDVTEQKELEQHLIKTEKLASIGLLSSGIAHELRNPLNIIETARYAIETELDHENIEVDKRLKVIKSSIQRSSAIIDNLLQFSRHSKFAKEKVDVAVLVKSTISLLFKEITQHNIQPLLALAETRRAFINIDSLKQVFLNIILNAVQAMPGGGELRIRTFETDDKEFVAIEFKDDGVGIAKEHLQHLFTPFFTTKGPTSGTGLGLYLSYTLLNREGGEMQVESSEGEGATFTVLLPLAKDD